MIVNLHSASELSKLARKGRDFDLAFTSGCFDLLHSGHIYFLNELHSRVGKIKNKERQVRTLVVIHSDDEVRKHKGNNRPIFTQAHRLLLLDNLRTVDFVGIWYGWESIVELVYALEPDFMITNSSNLKKNDWEHSWQKVAAKVNSHLIGVPRIDQDISTTAFIEKIKQIK